MFQFQHCALVMKKVSTIIPNSQPDNRFIIFQIDLTFFVVRFFKWCIYFFDSRDTHAHANHKENKILNLPEPKGVHVRINLAGTSGKITSSLSGSITGGILIAWDTVMLPRIGLAAKETHLWLHWNSPEIPEFRNFRNSMDIVSAKRIPRTQKKYIIQTRILCSEN